MKRPVLSLAFLLSSVLVTLFCAGAQAQNLDVIKTVVVLYAENRSFDNLYGTLPRRQRPAERRRRQHAAARPRRQRAQANCRRSGAA